MQRFLNPNPTRASRSKEKGPSDELIDVAVAVTAAATHAEEDEGDSIAGLLM